MTLPARIGAPAKVLQMVIVTSPNWRSTTGTLRAWQRPRGGTWSVVHGPLPVVLGYAGWVIADQRVQSTGTTPAGRFTLPSAFGLAADPGTALPYRRVDGNDWWPYEPRDPATYNIYQGHRDSHSHWRPDFSEQLADYPGQYDYAAVIGFNLPHGIHYSPKRHQWIARDRARIHRGGGIFLHVRGSGTTAGCVAMDRADMAWLLRWLDPGRHPQVVMGPYDYVLTL
jgi:L,D-peptidoglycan transpeptidase YkuD (ErfK/YbiS/YcfS/YnhG family)